MTYKIIRFYKDRSPSRRTLKRGLTLEEARAHCGDSETCSKTCVRYAGRKRTENLGEWFDGWTKETRVKS